MLLQRLQRCHNAPNDPSIVVGAQQLRRHCHQAAAAAAAARCSSTTHGPAAAAAAKPRRWLHAEYTSGLASLLASSQLPQAVALVDTWLDHKQRVHGVATGELLEALCSAGQHDTAWSLLRRLTAAQGRLPLQVLHRLLKLAGQFGCVDDVVAVHSHQQQLYGFASVGVQTTLVHALLKASSRAQPGHLLAYEAWARLKGSGRQLDAQALLAGMHACVCVGQLRAAEELLEPLRAAAGPVGRPLLSGYNLLLKGHAAAGNAEAARRVFGALTARGLSPDAVSFNTLLAAVARAGEWGRAAPLLQQMRLAGVQPDAWSFTTLAAELGKQGQLGQMQAVLQDMAAAGVAAHSATYAAVISAHAAAGDVGAAEQLLQRLLSSTSDVNLLLAASRSSSSSSSDGGGRNGNSSSSSSSDSASSIRVEQGALLAAGFQAAAGGPLLLFNAAASSNEGSSSGHPEQQQQGPGSLAGGTRNSSHVLRHQYNSLINGWLQLAAGAHAAASSAALGQQWLPADAAASNGGSRTSSSSSSSSIWNGASQAAGVQSGRAGLLQQAPPAQLTPKEQQLLQPATAAASGDSRAAAFPASVGAASGERSAAAARPVVRSALLQSTPALVRPVLPPQPQAGVQAQPAHASVAPNGTAGAVHNGSSSSSSRGVAPAAVVSRQAAAFGEALALLQRMQAAGVAPAADTYTPFIRYCIKVGDANWLQHMLSTASASGVQPDQVLLTTLIKAAWQVEDRAAAIDVFNALLHVVTPFNSSSSKSSSPVASMDGSSSDSMAGHEGSQQQPPPPQQQQQQQPPPQQHHHQQGVSRPSVSQAVRAYANAAAASAAAAAVLEQAARSAAPASSSSSGASSSPGDTAAAVPAAAGGEPGQQPGQPPKIQQQQRRGQQQLLLPLTAPKGPDAAAWNALAAAMARAGQLDEAARAVERGAQAAAACGASRPPVEGFGALVRGYRRARLKEQAVSALRHFLNLGGRPVRVMCDDVVALCLEQGDVRTGRQVVRAMELTGCLGEADASFYAAWFARWEAGRAAASASSGSRYGASAGATAGGGPGTAAASSSGDSAGNASAVERLKWWLGLPNSYYSDVAAQQQRAEQAQADARARAAASSHSSSSSSSLPGGGATAASQLQQQPPSQAGR